ncbi:MAG: fibronectin type III domain-containing protein, partial [Glutamicibacter sp.]
MLDISDGSASLIARATLRDAEAGFDLTNLSSITLGGVNPKFISIRKNEIQIEQKITFAQFNPDNPSRGEISVMVGGVKDLVGNVPSGWRAESVGSVVLATRPLRGQRPTLSIKTDGIFAEWSPPQDPLPLTGFELEVRNQKNQASRTFVADEPIFLLSELVSGKYTARVRSINILGKGAWSTYSEPIDFVRPKVVAPAKVSVEGTTKVGKTLTSKSGAWTPSYAELNYKWFADGKVISDEKSSSLVMSDNLVGKRVAVQVTGKLLGHADATISSAQSTVVVPSNPNVSASKPVFNASKNQVVIPKSASASYSINGTKFVAGTYNYGSTGIVTAAPTSKYYKLVGVTSWKFDNRDEVTPAKPTFNSSKNTVKIPSKTGITYYVNGTKKKSGTHKYTGTGTVTAKASSGSYKLSGTKSWKFDNRNSVTASKPVFNAKKNTVKIPSKTGVTYYVNGTKKKSGTHKYTGTGTVTAKASSG